MIEACKPDEVFTIDCNECNCPSDGSIENAECDRMGCFGYSNYWYIKINYAY